MNTPGSLYFWTVNILGSYLRKQTAPRNSRKAEIVCWHFYCDKQKSKILLHCLYDQSYSMFEIKTYPGQLVTANWQKNQQKHILVTGMAQQKRRRRELHPTSKLITIALLLACILFCCVDSAIFRPSTPPPPRVDTVLIL
jgi:hypothetical protein